MGSSPPCKKLYHIKLSQVMKLNPVRYYILHGAHPCKILFTTWRLHLENKSYKCVYCMFTLNILLKDP